MAGPLALMVVPWVLALQVGAGPHTRIYGGKAVGRCDFPSAVSIDDSCSGTLVHPQVVVFAGHCGADVKQIGFGASNSRPDRVVAPKACYVFPGYNGEGSPFDPNDVAFCVLDTPVRDIPATPIAMGCELEALGAGIPCTAVGFGVTASGADGGKQAVSTALLGITDTQVTFGGGGKDTCDGDSGGPVFVQFTSQVPVMGTPDNGLRVVGSTSTGIAGDDTEDCGQGSIDPILARAVPWIEAQSGIDISPCFTADGTWSPGPGCYGFPAASSSATSGASGCAAPTLTGYSATCGAPYAAGDPNTATSPPFGSDSPGTQTPGTAEVPFNPPDRPGGCAQLPGSSWLLLAGAAAARLRRAAGLRRACRWLRP